MRNRTLLATTIALGALAAGAPGVAFAQAASTASAGEDRSKVETVIVTARKKEETLISTPVAVTAVGTADIARLGIQAIDDLARFTPGLSFSKAFGRATDRPVVRGAASILAGTQPGVEAGTAYFVDGVYYQGDISSIDLADVQRVEVIKGPQSALYGRNTYSGAINFITNSPGSAFRANATASAAEHGERSLTARVAGPITEWLSGSLAARYYTYDGEWANAAAPGETLGSEQTQSVSAVLEARPLPGLTMRGRVVMAQDDDGPRAFGFQDSSQNNCFPGFRSNAYRGSPLTTNNNPNQYFCGVIKDAGVYAQNTGFGGTFAASPFLGVRRDLLFGSLINDVELPNGMNAQISIGYRDERLQTGSDSDFKNGASFPQGGTPAAPASNSLFGSAGWTDSEDISIEAKIGSSVEQRFRWMVGVYGYQLDQTNFDQNFSFAGSPDLARRSGTNATTNTAVFGRLSYDITEKLSVDAEARQQRERRSTQSFSTATATLGAFTYNDTRSFKSFTPRVTVNYKPSEDVTVYGIYAQGTKPGGLNGSLGVQNGFPTFEPETSTNIELGFKARIADGRGTIALSAYKTDADEMQLTTAVVGGGGILTSIVTNQGNAEIAGFEADIRYRLTENLGVGFTFSRVNSEFTEGCDEFEYTLTSGGFQIGTTCTTTRRVGPSVVALPDGTFSPLPGATGSIVGNRIPLVPENQASFNVDYSRELGANGMEFFASADVSYESSKFVQVHNRAETGDTTLVGGRFGLSGERWTLAVWGKNLTDEDSIPIATRWFDVFQGSAASVGLTNPVPPATTGPATGIDTGSPRAFFYSPRRGRTIGVELKLNY
jgi:outer membrane receptor protein involved in Fe transport